MGELVNYFGNDLMAMFAAKAQEKYTEFYKQSKSTKADLADDLKTKVGVYEQAAHELLGCLEDSAAKNRLKDSIIKAMEKEFGVSNLDFIKRDKLQVVVSEENLNAKEVLVEYLAKKYPKGLVQATKAQK